jgi:hypothetical protein
MGTQFSVKEWMMNQIGEFLGQYATKEVLTVMGALVTAWLGWKAAKGSYGMVASIAKKASFMGLASAVMLAVGLGAAGLGIGELNSRPEVKEETNVVGLTNNDLLKIVNNEKASPELVKAILEYAKARDKGDSKPAPKVEQASNVKVAYRIEDNKLIPVSLDEPVLRTPYEEITIDPVKESVASAEESIVSLPMAWALIGMGLATSISGIAVFANRHNKRNSDDPNHPNFESQYKRA